MNSPFHGRENKSVTVANSSRAPNRREAGLVCGVGVGGWLQAREAVTSGGDDPVARTATPMVEVNLHVWFARSESLLLMSSNWAIALLESARPPSLVPLLSACLPEVSTPFAEH